MLEIPEAAVIAGQLREQLLGMTLSQVTVNQSPHKFAFFQGDPLEYPALLVGKKFADAVSLGGMVELRLDDLRLVITDGVNLRYLPAGGKPPSKHQLLLQFTDGSCLSASVQMYGMLWLFAPGEFDNPYYHAAWDKPSPLSEDFSLVYFRALAASPAAQKLSLKAFLATEQRIPGLGNGVLQEILWQAQLHPRRKLATVDGPAMDALHHSIQAVLRSMVASGGRDTEKDLFGRPGGYFSPVSSLHYRDGCPRCGGPIMKEAYLGGSVYTCPDCQRF